MKTLILAGGGHAHLHCLEKLKNSALEDVRVLLISPSRFQYYSGMFSGYAEGIYSLDDIRIDLKRLSEKTGAIFIEDSIVSVDPETKELAGGDGEIYRFDVASFDIGSQTDAPDALKNQVSSIKPNYRFPGQLLKLRDAPAPVLVGGGAAGVEMAFSILAWRKKSKLPVNVALFSSTSLLAGQGSGASRKIEAIARKKALQFFPGITVDSADDTAITASNGESFPHSGILWLTGPKSPVLFRLSGLPTDEGGFLSVTDSLQSIRHPDIFGAGDCISMERYPSLAKNGVYAVRQGPILWNNLKNSLSNGKLIPFIPQKRFVSILSTGGGEALLSYGAWSIHGKIPWKVKQRIDRNFIERYKNLYE